MRRYGQTETRVTVPGVNAGLKLTLQPAAPSAVPCKPAPAGLYWFSDVSGEFSAAAEAAFVLPTTGDPPAADTVAPILAVARVLGETCDAVTWRTTWTPDEEGGPPGLAEVGADLLVYPTAATGPGVLTVRAECGGQSFGPISLGLVLRYCGPDIRGLCVWHDQWG